MDSYTSIVDKDVQPSEVVLDPLEGRFNIRIFGDVTLDGVQFTCRRLQRFGQFLGHSNIAFISTNIDVFYYTALCSLMYGYQQWRTQEFCGWGVQQIQLRTEDRQNGDRGAVAP